jgi:hypothetical protein
LLLQLCACLQLLLLCLLPPLLLQHCQHLAQDDAIQLCFEQAGQAVWPTLLQEPVERGGSDSSSSSSRMSGSVSNNESLRLVGPKHKQQSSQ